MKSALDDPGWHRDPLPGRQAQASMPESWLMSSDIVKELGWLACPSLQHFHLDDVIAELGKRSQLIQGCPEVIIEHLHYTTGNSPRDEIYSYAEETWGIWVDQAYQLWRATVMPHQVAGLRREFNPDVKWAMSKSRSRMAIIFGNATVPASTTGTFLFQIPPGPSAGHLL